MRTEPVHMVGWLGCLLMDNYQTSILKVSGLLNCLKQRVLLLEIVLDKGYGLILVLLNPHLNESSTLPS